MSTTDSLPWIDTLDQSRKILVAYHRNDTTYLSKSLKEVQELMKYREQMVRDPSCPQPQSIDTYDFDEAYRFQYGAAFCDQAVNLTVAKRNDSVVLFGYHYKLVYNTDSCLSFQTIEKLLTLKQWDSLKQGILRADFWGLKQANDRNGVDGSGLTVTGYQKPIKAFLGRYHRIYRWAAEEMAVGELFKQVLNMSGTNASCFHFY